MTNDATVKDKKPRFRSPPYPAIPLDKAIGRAESFYTNALHHAVPLSVAASAWGYGEKSSGLFATIAALKQFGLVSDEGSGVKRRFKLTDSGIRVVRDPDPNSEKRKIAIDAAALAPKIHAELWEKYGVAGVSSAMNVALKSYLTLDRSDEGAAPYSGAAADEVISEYCQTMAFAELIEHGSVSSEVDVELETDNLGIQEGQSSMDNFAQIPNPPTSSTPRRLPIEEGELNDIRAELSGGRVRINAVMDLEGLEKLEKQIIAFKALLS